MFHTPTRPRPSAPRVAALVAVALGASGCESFFLPDTPATEPAVVVDGAFPIDSVWSVSLTRLRPLGDDRPGPAPEGFTVEDADVAVRAEGGPTIPLSHVGAGRYTSTEGLRPEPGAAYRLTVVHPELGRAEALGWAPARPTFDVGPAVGVGGSAAPDPTAEYRFTLTLHGGGGPQGGSYAVALSQVQPPSEGEIDQRVRARPLAFEADDPDLRSYFFDIGPVRTYTAFYSGAVLRVPVPDGEQRVIEVTARATTYPESGREIYVHVTAISGALRDHLFTRSLQEQYEEDPFAGPVPLTSNVEGGRGVFGGYASRTVTVPLED